MGTAEFSMPGEVVLVTGGRQGIGKAIALAIAEAGANVAICDVVSEDGELQAVAKEIERLGRHSLAIHADTSKRTDVEAMVERVMHEFGRIDVLVNNAGIAIRKPLMDTTENGWDKLMGIDIKGYYLCAQAVARRMIEQKRGSMINLASQYAFRVIPGMGLYAIAKAGVTMLTRALAQELGKFGIRVNAIAPGMVRTEFARYRWGDPQFIQKFEAAVPLGRIADPTDLTGVVLFLASRASEFVTGQIISVDGGEGI
jgi:NAD(P)-dependent dehydrogenase (short-subunit alcohol dehydrogenase family)